MKILITGGLGFIGGNFIINQLESGKNEIFNIDKETYAANQDLKKDFEKNSKYSFLNADIADQGLKNIILEYDPEVILNFAAETHVDRSIDNSSDFLNTNILGTVNLLEIALVISSKNKDFKFIQISTDEVFGDAKDGEFFDEKNNIITSSPYSASKASAELFVNAYKRTFGLKCLIANISNNYGPYQTEEKLIPRSITRLLNGLKVEIYGDGNNERDWIWVGDACNAINWMLETKTNGDRYCIGNGKSISNLEIVSKIIQIIDRKYGSHIPDWDSSVNANIEFVQDRPGHDFAYRINSDLLKNESRWMPGMSIEDGLEKTIDFYFENIDKANKRKNFMNRIGKVRSK
jgi:dTDP-glucose 4,6-dehydratase